MSWQEWVSVVLSGAVGALVGLVGVYMAFRMSTRSDQRAARAAETSTAVARIASAQWELARRLATGRFLTAEAAIVDFNAACALFAVTEIREHRGVALWVIGRSERVTKMYARRPGTFVGLWARRATMGRISKEMGQTVGVLVGWVAGEYSDRWFDDRPDGRAD